MLHHPIRESERQMLQNAIQAKWPTSGAGLLLFSCGSLFCWTNFSTGTLWTATAHAITALIGSGVLAVPWSVAQMGWLLGPLILVVFAYITYYTATLLSDYYRSPAGRRNYTYIGVVKAYLGARDVLVCGITQYSNLWVTSIGYTITAATSMMAVQRSDCLHEKGHNATCRASGNLYMIIFGAIEIVLSQCPNLEKVTFLSVVASVMAFGYSFIALYLCIVKFASNQAIRGSLVGDMPGTMGLSLSEKIWHFFQAVGNIAFAYTFAMLLVEIQDTVKSPPPEHETMKKASMYGIGLTTMFYISLGCVGYAAFGNGAPGNILTGFHEPFWLVDIANIGVIIHLIGAYQVFLQPVFAFYEKWLASRWPTVGFFHKIYTFRLPFDKSRSFQFTLCRLVLRTVFVVFTTLVSMMLPFFNAVLGLLGAMAFWPLTVYYPVTMYITQSKIKRGTSKWLVLQGLSMFALIVSLVSAVGSVADIIQRLKHARMFHISY